MIEKIKTELLKISYGTIIKLILITLVLYFATIQLNSLNDKLENLNSMFGKQQVDTVVVEVPDSCVTLIIDDDKIMNSLKEYMENLSIHVTNNVTDTVTNTVFVTNTDTIYNSFTTYVDSKQPTWGTTIFSDSSNFFTDILVRVDWPYGKKNITYMTKYQIRKFGLGIGKINNNWSLMGSFKYKQIGISGVLQYDEEKRIKPGYIVHYWF